MDPGYTVYVKADGSCPLCHQAEALLRGAGARCDVVPYDSFDEVAEGLRVRGVLPPQARTFPQIVVGASELVGGFDKLRDRLDEPLLEENPLRFTLFPIKYPDLYEMYQKALASFWTPQEVSLAGVLADCQAMVALQAQGCGTTLAFPPTRSRGWCRPMPCGPSRSC